MSAFIVSDLHAFTLADFVAKRYTNGAAPAPSLETFTQSLANSLKRINIESVNYRYRETTPRTKCKPQTVDITEPAAVYRLFECWSYQACENANSYPTATAEQTQEIGRGRMVRLGTYGGPASKEAGQRATCLQCKLCSGSDLSAKSVVIVAHGLNKAKV